MSCSDAIAILKDHTPDLVLLDTHLACFGGAAAFISPDQETSMSLTKEEQHFRSVASTYMG